MKRGKKDFLIAFILMLFILIVLINIFLLTFFSTKITTSASQADVKFEITKSRAIKVISDTFDGDTTSFTLGNNSKLEAVENLTLEKTGFGKIIFLEPINLKQDAKNITDDELFSRKVDLDNNVIISKNLIEVNTANLKNLEKSAILSLYGLDFKNPRILRNNEICSPSICQIIDYSNGILKFSVTSFTSYSAEEIPTEVKATGGACTYNWECSDWQPLICPENGIQTRTCVNKGTCGGIVGKPDETRTCISGQISEEVLFDVEVKILTKEVSAGDEVLAEIELIKFSGEKVDVEVDYSIKDQFNNTLSTKHEIVAVETKTSFIGQLTVPDEAKVGTYTFHARAIYKEQSWEASESFEVIKKLIEIPAKAILEILIVMFIVFIVILFYEYKKMKELNKLFRKVTEKDLIRKEYIKK